MDCLTFWDQCAGLSGVEIPEGKWLDSKLRSVGIEKATRFIASQLELAGIAPRRAVPGQLAIVGTCSGRFAIVEPWRHINFLPEIAASNRSQMVKRLSYFGEKRPHLRYLVVTNGQRCPVQHVRERLQSLAREVSRWAASPELKDFSVRVELRVSELTAERDSEGRWSYHPHANVIIDCQKVIDWQKFLAFTSRSLRGHWHDCGKLVDANEAIKYFVKPVDVVAHEPLELAALYHATFGLRLATPMGAFKDFGHDMKRQKVKLGKRLDKEGVWRWCFVKLNGSGERPARNDPDMRDTVITKLAPSPRFSSRFEPCLLVRDYSGNLEHLLNKNKLALLFAPARAAWRARSAIPFTPSPQLTATKRDMEGLKVRAGPREYVLASKT